MEPMHYPEPRDIKVQLMRKFNFLYKNCNISDIPYSTEIILKSIKNKDPSKLDHILLKYRIINTDWEELRHEKGVKYNSHDFRWIDTVEQNHEF